MLDQLLIRLIVTVFFSLSALSCTKTTVKSNLLYSDNAKHSDECVVFLHGLARSSKSMRKLEQAFNNAGYRTLNIDYPSTRFDHQTLLSKYIAPTIQQSCSPALYHLHFVGHSMGGILAVKYVKDNPLPKQGKIVTIGSPHLGSELVNKLGWIPLFKWINGPSGYEMTVVNADKLENPDVSLLAIAGGRSTNPFYSMLIPGKDDGKVSIDSAAPSYADKTIIVPYAHTFIMKKPEVIRQALEFIQSPSH